MKTDEKKTTLIIKFRDNSTQIIRPKMSDKLKEGFDGNWYALMQHLAAHKQVRYHKLV